MPRVLDIDWDHAKHLFFQGVSTRDIALEMGCGESAVRSRCTREAWMQKKEALRIAEQKQVNGLVMRDLKELANDLKQRLSIDAERTLQALETQDPTRMTLERLETRERIASALQKRTWTTLGLDLAEQGCVAVNVLMMGKIQESIMKQAEGVDSQVIDCAVVEEVKDAKQGNEYCAKGVEGAGKASFPGGGDAAGDQATPL